MPRKPKQERHKGVYEKIKGSGIWWIRYTNQQGKRVTTSVGTHSAAVALYDRRKTDLRLGIITPPSRPRSQATFQELVGDAIQYYKDHDLRDVANLTQRTNQLLPEFGKRLADSITSEELQQHVDKLAKARGWSGATRNAIRAALSTVFREGLRSKKVTSNPTRQLRRAKESLGRIRFLTEAEEADLRKHTPASCIPQLDIALYTGMRRGEQFSATWDQVDFTHKHIYLDRTKNGSSRHVFLNSAALQTLKALRDEHRRLELRADSRLFLSQREGETIANPRKWFETALRKAKIEGVTWHILRHTFASRLVMHGVDLRTVQELMGHKTLAMTIRYSHLAPSHQISALELLVPQGTIPEPIQK